MHILPSIIQGEIDIPPSKSHSQRAILFASLAEGKSIIRHVLASPDIIAMIHACRAFGAGIQCHDKHLEIMGVSGKPCFTDTHIQAGNSGQVLRFIGAVAGLAHQKVYIQGDASIQKQRPVLPLISGLNQLGCVASNEEAPLVVQGPFLSNEACIEGRDSQPVSGLLIARAFAPRPLKLRVENPGETPWVELTLDWFRRLGITYQQKNYQEYQLDGHANVLGFEYDVPGDYSTCAFPLVAAILTQGQLQLNHLDGDDVQGDKRLLEILQKMGAKIEFMTHQKKLLVFQGEPLQGLEIDVNDIIDAIPILAVVGCFAKGRTILKGAHIARFKESDRIAVMCQELKKLGAKIEETEDGLIIEESSLRCGEVFSHHDHRVAMALAVAGLMIPGGVLIHETQCIEKSFPDFKNAMRKIGAEIA